jgi:hypothetical protein
MEIKVENDGLLTNLEVIELIRERQLKRDKIKRNFIDLQSRVAMEQKVKRMILNA